MKRALSKKTLCLAAAALLLAASAAVGSVYAYFTTYALAGGRVVFEMGHTETIPHEDVTDGKKIVSIENTGDYDCYVRVRAYAGSQYQDGLEYSDESRKWYDGGDGFWYYKDILPAGEISGAITVSIPSGLFEDVLEGEKDLNVIVIQECTPVVYDEKGEPYADWSAAAADSGKEKK